MASGSTSLLWLAALACLAASLTPAAGQCSDAASNVASACSEFEGDVSSNSGAASDNSSISSAIDSSSTTISSGCCDAFSSFLSQSCRCNSDSEPLISAVYTDDQFQQVVYAAAIACQGQGTTLLDPQYGETCNGGVVSGG